jgi:hypothetical protein
VAPWQHIDRETDDGEIHSRVARDIRDTATHCSARLLLLDFGFAAGFILNCFDRPLIPGGSVTGAAIFFTARLLMGQPLTSTATASRRHAAWFCFRIFNATRSALATPRTTAAFVIRRRWRGWIAQ